MDFNGNEIWPNGPKNKNKRLTTLKNMRTKKLKEKNIVEATKDNSKNTHPPEIVFNYGCGEILLGKNISTVLHFPHTKESYKDSIIDEWDCYTFENDIEAMCENNIITGLRFDTQCWYKGFNLIGMRYDFFLSIVGHRPEEEDYIYVKKGYKKNGEYQHVYDFYKEALQVWVWRGKIDTIILSGYNIPENDRRD